MNIKIIRGKRGSGKTKKLIELSAKNGGHIVCQNKQHSEYILNFAKELNLEIPKPYTYSEILDDKILYTLRKEIYIDDVDYFLNFLFKFRAPVRAITLLENIED